MPLMEPSSEGENCRDLVKHRRNSPLLDLLAVVDKDSGRKHTLFRVRHMALLVTMEPPW
jgi:hypothetical protein